MAMIVMLACSPISKESYIKQYDAFISEVSENYKSYDDKAWEKQTAKYEKFSGEWYNKFKTELALKEELAIKANQAKWYYYRNMNAATSVVKQLFESLDVKGMKKQVQYYIDNNMQSDLQKFYKDAQKAGKAVEETVTDILEELDVNIEELQ
jgi:hypothetical protein